MRVSLVLGLMCAVIAVQGKSTGGKAGKWALLASTSKGWINYRHQADMCHAYQLLRANGYKKENIITMMYDDIAFNTENPHKGTIINRPNGPNVYQGVVKDYTGEDVTVDNFLNILSGNKTALQGIGSGRVIESGPDDHIFVYVVDHGDTGILLFPNEEYLFAHQLSQKLRQMRQSNSFNKMVMYIEACKAGSMFDNILDDDSGVFVQTASATDELSYATYCETMKTCLGDLFSTVWMENMDLIREEWSASLTTLFKQYRHTRTLVDKSHVMIYGDFRLGFERASAYLGDDWMAAKGLPHQPQTSKPSTPVLPTLQATHVPVPDVHMYLLQQRALKSQDQLEQHRLRTEISELKQKREFINSTVHDILKLATKGDEKLLETITGSEPRLTEEVFECYQSMVEMLNAHCWNTYKNPHSTSHFYKLANACLSGVQVSSVKEAMVSVCGADHSALLGAH